MTSRSVTKRDRNPNVSDEVIIEAWQRISVQTDEQGNKTGTIQQVADEVGMKKQSLTQRLGKLRKALAATGRSLNDMPRAKGGGRKKDVDKLGALLDAVNDKLATTNVELDDEFTGDPVVVGESNTDTTEVADEVLVEA